MVLNINILQILTSPTGKKKPNGEEKRMHMRKGMGKDHIKDHTNKALAATGPCISHIKQTTGEALLDVPHGADSYLFKQLLNKQRQFSRETQVIFCFFQNRESFFISYSLKQSRFLCNWTAAVKITV